MTDFRISGNRGASIGFQFTVTRNGGPIDLTAAGMKLIVTGKLNTSDATPVFVADYYQAGGAPNGKVTLPDPINHDVAQVDLPANEPGIVALAKTSYIQVSAVLVEPNARETEVATGVIKLRVTAGS